jgi:formylglycine-generating enzyme required for sulfatase activity
MGHTAPATSILTKDGSTLRLIPGGKITLPGNSNPGPETAIKVDSFYIDEAPVTNYQYVQFLNQNLSTLIVAKYGVRFMDNGFGEWSLRGIIVTSRQSVENADYILMPSGVIRQPWEAFEKVGFRCSLNEDERIK